MAVGQRKRCRSFMVTGQRSLVPHRLLPVVGAVKTRFAPMPSALTSEMWETVGDVWLEILPIGSKSDRAIAGCAKYLDWIKPRSHLVTIGDGARNDAQGRGSADFLRAGHLHRTRRDNTARLLDFGR